MTSGTLTGTPARPGGTQGPVTGTLTDTSGTLTRPPASTVRTHGLDTGTQAVTCGTLTKTKDGTGHITEHWWTLEH